MVNFHTLFYLHGAMQSNYNYKSIYIHTSIILLQYIYYGHVNSIYMQILIQFYQSVNIYVSLF